jgi:hypothetical protein
MRRDSSRLRAVHRLATARSTVSERGRDPAAQSQQGETRDHATSAASVLALARFLDQRVQFVLRGCLSFTIDDCRCRLLSSPVG